MSSVETMCETDAGQRQDRGGIGIDTEKSEGNVRLSRPHQKYLHIQNVSDKGVCFMMYLHKENLLSDVKKIWPGGLLHSVCKSETSVCIQKSRERIVSLCQMGKIEKRIFDMQ